MYWWASDYSTISFSVTTAPIVLPIRAGRCEATAEDLSHLPPMILVSRRRMASIGRFRTSHTSSGLLLTRRPPKK